MAQARLALPEDSHTTTRTAQLSGSDRSELRYGTRPGLRRGVCSRASAALRPEPGLKVLSEAHDTAASHGVRVTRNFALTF